ncbi:MAG: hypothetical protein AAF547_05425 [Actinomycetota bacterium]
MSGLIEPQVFVTAKPGERPESCQDVAWFDPAVAGGPVAGFAVADGATGGWDGRRWAELVVDAAADAIAEAGGAIDGRWVRAELADALDRARETWRLESPSSEPTTDPVAALARAKFKTSGGQCTLTAGVLWAGTEGSWHLRAFAVGDSPLVHLRPSDDGYRVLLAAPQHRADQFDTHPTLISSKPPGPGAVVPGLSAIAIDDLAVGDAVLVMTDAIAAWALHRDEVIGDPWGVLVGLDHAGFGALIDRTRTTDEMAADDVLLLRMTIAAQPYRALPTVGPLTTPTQPIGPGGGR